MTRTTKLPRLLGVALTTVLALGACQRGQGGNDTLADGATDRPRENSGASGIGPSAPQVDAAGPGVGNSAQQPGGATPGAGASPTLVLVPQGPRGAYVTDGAGVTVYALDGDTDGGKCGGDCLTTWTPLLATGQQPSGGPGLQGALITTITRADGSRQVAYDGHPLYRWANDGGAGKTGGDGVKDAYGAWRMVTPTGAAPAPAAATSGATPGT